MARAVAASLLGIAFVLGVATSRAQKMNVRIIKRQSSDTDYSYVVPGHSTSWTNGSGNCNVGSTIVNCSGSAHTNTSGTASQAVSYSVTGATFTLLLPDGRMAVVNCVSKFQERMAGFRGNHRSCRTPLVNEIEAEFSGSNAKLRWAVSLDGKKTESETYKILAIMDGSN